MKDRVFTLYKVNIKKMPFHSPGIAYSTCLPVNSEIEYELLGKTDYILPEGYDLEVHSEEEKVLKRGKRPIDIKKVGDKFYLVDGDELIELKGK